MRKPTILERAFELAEVGPSSDLRAIKIVLKREGYDAVDAHLKSRSVAKQLLALCKARALETTSIA